MSAKARSPSGQSRQQGPTEAGDVQVMSAASGVRHSEIQSGAFRRRGILPESGIAPGRARRPADLGRKAVPKRTAPRKFVTIASGFKADNDALTIRADESVLAATMKAVRVRNTRRDQSAQHLYLVRRRQREVKRRIRQTPATAPRPHRGGAEDHRAGGFELVAGRRGVLRPSTNTTSRSFMAGLSSRPSTPSLLGKEERGCPAQGRA